MVSVVDPLVERHLLHVVAHFDSVYHVVTPFLLVALVALLKWLQPLGLPLLEFQVAVLLGRDLV